MRFFGTIVFLRLCQEVFQMDFPIAMLITAYMQLSYSL